MPEVGVIKPNHLHYVSETPALKKRKGVLYFSGKGALLNRNIHQIDAMYLKGVMDDHADLRLQGWLAP